MSTPATLSSVPAQTPYIQYVATSGQTVFPYPFEITQDSDLVVVANGTTLATDSGYTVSGVGASTGGNITFTSGRAAGDIITLFRDIPISRVSQIAQNSGFSSTVFNAEYNNVYLLLQQLQQNIDQCLQIPNTNNPAPTTSLTPANFANKYLAFDANGNPTPAVLTSSGSLTRSIIGGLLGYLQDNVLLHGADDTGAADSLAAFNAATAANSDYVLVPPGTYKLSGNTNAGLWEVSSGVTFTGAGILIGKTIQKYNPTSDYILQLVSNVDVPAVHAIGLDVELGLYQTGTQSALQFGQTTEVWTPSASTTIWSGQTTATYGSFSHFGSGAVSSGAGGNFEAFNSGSAAATLLVGVNGNAWNGGVSAGLPAQTPTNNGTATNLRGVSGFVSNGSSGVVTNAAALYANAATNTGTGSITNLYGLYLADQTAGTNNYGIFTGIGYNLLGDVLEVNGHTNLPASAANKFILAGALGGSSNGRLYCGDGSGWRLEFASRIGSADTVVGWMTDGGNFIANGLKSQSSTIGYTTGSGSTATQLTSKATAVTLNKATGTITTNNAALASGATATFNFNNSNLNTNSILVLSIQATGATTGAYAVTVDNMQVGVCNISIHNQSGGSLSEAIILNFAIIQASAS